MDNHTGENKVLMVVQKKSLVYDSTDLTCVSPCFLGFKGNILHSKEFTDIIQQAEHKTQKKKTLTSLQVYLVSKLEDLVYQKETVPPCNHQSPL